MNKNHKIEIYKGDFGYVIPIKIKPKDGAVIDPTTSFKLTIYKSNGDILWEDSWSAADERGEIQFTKEESESFEIGFYNFSIRWYKDNQLLKTILPKGTFIVRNTRGGVENG